MITKRKPKPLTQVTKCCGSTTGFVIQTNNLHAGQVVCSQCLKHHQWLSKKDMRVAIATGYLIYPKLVLNL